MTGEKFDPSKPLKMPGDDEEDEDVAGLRLQKHRLRVPFPRGPSTK